MTPVGWRELPLADCVDVLDSRRVPVSAKERLLRPGLIPYYGATGKVGTIDAALFDEDLVLLGEDGVQFFDPNKPKAYRISGPAWVNNHAHVLRPRRDVVDDRFLTYALNRANYTGYANGTTRLKLTKSAMLTLPVPVPRLDEQRRIVALLEDHFSRLDAALSGLRLAMKRLARLEQAVLAECYLSGAEAARLGELAAIQGGIQKQPKRAPAANAHPFLRVANVTARGLELQDVHQIELFEGELDKLRLLVGDLLVVEGNGSASQIGRAALWNGQIEDCVHQNHLIRVRPGPRLSPAYLEAIWNSPQNREQLTALSSSSSGLHTLSVAKLKSLVIPVASPADQQRGEERVSALRATKERLLWDLNAAVARAAQLRQSVLSAAFSGQLTSAHNVEELARV